MGCASSVKVHPIKNVACVATQTDDLTNGIITVAQTNDPIYVSDTVTSFSRISPNNNERDIKWNLTDMSAANYSMMVVKDLSVITDYPIREAYQAMKLCQDLQHLPQKVWALLQTANDTNDAKYFIRAYTTESDLYRILNRCLAQQANDDLQNMGTGDQMGTLLNNAMEQLTVALSQMQQFQAGQPLTTANSRPTTWARLFLRAIFRFLCIPNPAIRFQGKVYRGLWLPQNSIQIYHRTDLFICNKAVTSTSKLETVALGFLHNAMALSSDMIPALITYQIDSQIALYSISIKDFSDIPAEDEVLILPGVLMTVVNAQFDDQHIFRIELRSAIHDMANMIQNMMPSLSALVN